MAANRSANVRYLYMKENNEDIPVTDLGYLPTFNPDNLPAMGQYTDPNQANLTVGANQFTATSKTIGATKCAAPSVSFSTSAAAAMR